MPPGTTLRNIRVADDLWAAAQERAERDGTTVSDAVRGFLADWSGYDETAPSV